MLEAKKVFDYYNAQFDTAKFEAFVKTIDEALLAQWRPKGTVRIEIKEEITRAMFDKLRDGYAQAGWRMRAEFAASNRTLLDLFIWNEDALHEDNHDGTS